MYTGEEVQNLPCLASRRGLVASQFVPPYRFPWCLGYRLLLLGMYGLRREKTLPCTAIRVLTSLPKQPWLRHGTAMDGPLVDAESRSHLASRLDRQQER